MLGFLIFSLFGCIFWYIKYLMARKRALDFAERWKQECVARMDDFIKEHAGNYDDVETT